MVYESQVWSDQDRTLHERETEEQREGKIYMMNGERKRERSKGRSISQWRREREMRERQRDLREGERREREGGDER